MSIVCTCTQSATTFGGENLFVYVIPVTPYTKETKNTPHIHTVLGTVGDPFFGGYVHMTPSLF